jgi:hypothetical protein
MKNLFKWTSLLLVAILVLNVSCDEDSPNPVDNTPDPTGKWVLVSAELIDGNSATPDVAEDLVVSNVLGPGEATIPVGDTQTTLALLTGFLLNAACEDVTAEPDGYFLELTTEGSDNKLYFGCLDGMNESKEESGSWNIIDNGDNTYNIVLTVAVGDASLPINFVNFVVAPGKVSFSGTAVGFPYVKDGLVDIGDLINPDDPTSVNLQVITTDMQFVPLP